MQAIKELQQLKTRIESQIAGMQIELETISKTIKILEREHPGAAAQMNLLPPQSPLDPATVRPTASLGLSDLCREILMDKWMAPAEVRDALMLAGYHNTDKGKLLSSVYATLKRLAENGDLETRKENGRNEFRKLLEVQAA